MNEETLAGAIALTLTDLGVKRMFGVPGGGSSLDLIDASAKHGIDFVLSRTENAAAIMAAVTGEMTGAPGVVLTGIGPGAASVTNGVAYASLERAPLIVFTDAHEETAIAPPHQIFDQRSMFEPITKARCRLNAEDGATVFAELADMAIAEPPGPVHIDLSAKVAGTTVKLKSAETPEPFKQQIIGDLSAATRVIEATEKPVLIVGHQCRPQKRAEAAIRLARALNGPVMTTYKAKGVFPETDALFVGAFTNAQLDHSVLAESDLIVLCGVDPVEMIPGNWTHDAPVVVLSETAGLALPFVAAEAISGPLADIAAPLSETKVKSAWKPEKIAAHRDRLRQTIANNSTPGRSPDEVIDAVAAAAPAGTRLAVDAGAHMFSTMARWPAAAPHDVLKSNGLSTMGFALPAALASWLEEPDRPAVAVTGDGGMMMCLGELSTASRLSANVTIVVFNDAALSLIDIKQQRQQRPPLGVRYPKSNFADAARALGCDAWTVGAQDPLEFALSEAFETDGPTLVDVTVDPSGYRDQLTALRG